MAECFRCGVPEDKVRLYDAISGGGIVRICSMCNAIEKLPLIKRPTTDQLRQSERQQTTKEKIAQFRSTPSAIGREVSLRELVDKKFRETSSKQIQPRPDLIDNFHWTIMRIRRMKHISREQFAKDLGETETVIQLLEQGIVPENDNKLINKVENYLGISLKRLGILATPPKSLQAKDSQKLSAEEQKKLSFDDYTAKNLKISDLRNMKKRRQEEDFNTYVETWGEGIESSEEKKEDANEEKRESSDYTISEGDIDEFF